MIRITLFILLILSSYSIIYAQLIHPEADAYYKTNASRLSAQDIPSIKYKSHNGTVWLKGGLKVSGKLRFKDIEDEVPKLEIKESGSRKKYTVEFPMIKRISMAGADDFTLRQDSTIFLWLEPLSGLFRQVQSGEVSLYDNVYIVNEHYTIIREYIAIAYNYYYNYVLINDVSDLREILNSNAYISDYAQSVGRSYSSDPYFINFLLSLYNHPDIVDDLGWSEMHVFYDDGRSQTGIGLVQPSMFTKNKKYPKYAVLHFKENGENQPTAIYHNDVKQVTWKGRTLKPVRYGHLNMFCWAESFQYESKVYLVTRALKNEAHYFLQYTEDDGEDLVFLVPEKSGDAYQRAHVVPAVRKAYLNARTEKKP